MACTWDAKRGSSLGKKPLMVKLLNSALSQCLILWWCCHHQVECEVRSYESLRMLNTGLLSSLPVTALLKNFLATRKQRQLWGDSSVPPAYELPHSFKVSAGRNSCQHKRTTSSSRCQSRHTSGWKVWNSGRHETASHQECTPSPMRK